MLIFDVITLEKNFVVDLWFGASPSIVNQKSTYSYENGFFYFFTHRRMTYAYFLCYHAGENFCGEFMIRG